MRFDTKKKIFEEEGTMPGKLAFASADRDISWRELKDLSDNICGRLNSIGIPQGHPVLLYGNKEIFLLATLISCYRMGLPFIPVSPDLPVRRIENIIRQSGSEVLVTSDLYTDLPNVPLIFTETKSRGRSSFKKRYPGIAYILFTSGSSGEPKGVLISDKNLAAFIDWFTKHFPVSNETVFINQAELSFDISLADIFGALQTGGSAILNTVAQYKNDLQFFERINKYKGNYWNSTPSFVLKYFASGHFYSEHLPTLKHFVLSGENLSSKLVKELMPRFPDASVINAYGPTETAIFASYVTITKELLSKDTLPVAGENDKTVSLEQDEIIISGPQVGKGYLYKEQLTRENFFTCDEQAAFRTGDFGFSRDGFLYFSGRKDDQVKFNGYRIELGEIKQTLEKIKGIEEAECLPVVIDGRVKRLIAFVHTRLEGNSSSIKNILEKELPAYMIPSEIILLKEFPHTSSFKVDRKKLLENYLRS